MKVKFLRGTTLAGKPVNEGDVLDLDDSTANRFIRERDAIAHVEPVKESPPAVVAETTEEPKKGKK